MILKNRIMVFERPLLEGADGPVMLRMFVVTGDDFSLIIDTAMIGYEEMAAEALAAVKQWGRPLAMVINTHAHHDHIGLNSWVRGQVPVLIASHAWGSRWIGDTDQNYREFTLGYPDIIQDSLELQSSVRGTMGPGTTMNVGFYGGEQVNLGSVPLEIVDLSGHLPGEVGVLVNDQRTLIMGDAFTGLNMPFFHSHVRPDLYRKTLERVAGMVRSGRVERILPTHLPPWNGSEAIYKAIEERRSELDSLDEALLMELNGESLSLTDLWSRISERWGKAVDFRGLNMIDAHLNDLCHRGLAGQSGRWFWRV